MALLGFISESATTLFWATIGGVFVFIGLCMEKTVEKKAFRDVRDLRRRKMSAQIGWWILMGGIIVEIATGGYAAWTEESKMRQIANALEVARYWRVITPADKKALVDRLKLAPELRECEFVFEVAADRDAIRYALKIKDALTAAGVESFSWNDGQGVADGVWVQQRTLLRSGEKPARASFDALMDAFHAAHIDVVETNGTGHVNAIVIYVGPKAGA
jgi:hypothetical protein